MKKIRYDKRMLMFIATILMTIDHITWIFYPEKNIISFSIHFITRLSAPLFFLFTAESIYHSRNKSKYVCKLFVLALISHYPYIVFARRNLVYSFLGLISYTSIIYNLLLGSLGILVYESHLNSFIKFLSYAIILAFSGFGDWPYFSVLTIFIFYTLDYDIVLRSYAFTVSWLVFIMFPVLKSIIRTSSTNWLWNLYLAGTILVIPLIGNYSINKKKPYYKSKSFLGFYYYPIHLAIIMAIYLLIL